MSLSGAYERKTNFHGRPALNIAAFMYRAKVDDLEAAAAVSAQMTLRGHAGGIRCPLYIVAGSDDRITPASEAQKLAEEAGGPVTLDVVDGGNHVVNNYWYRYRDQTADWLADHLT